MEDSVELKNVSGRLEILHREVTDQRRQSTLAVSSEDKTARYDARSRIIV